jgi:type VI secretion system protein ImpA
MSSPQLVELDTMIEPISIEKGTGSDVRLDQSPSSTYSRLRDARKAARAAERSNLFDNNSSAADEHWRTVLDLAPTILSGESKDLEVACWYTEALVRKSGFQGLRDGFRLIRLLIENYWDEIHPMPDEDGMATRVAALTGLNGEGAEGVLMVPMRNVSITDQIEPGPFNYWQYKQALDAQRTTDDDARAEIIAKNGFSIDDLQQAVEFSSQAFYIDLCDAIRDAIEEYKTISQLLDERCGIQDSPPTSNIINTLTEIQGAVLHIARLKLPQEIDDADTTSEAADTSDPASNSAGLAVKSRDDAFRQLAQISQFFRQTEPHSPISYVIDKAVKWGNMSLEELIQELIPDTGSRNTYSSLTGVNANDE